MSKKEPAWKNTTITGRWNHLHFSEVYGENWEEESIKAALERDVSAWRVFIPKIDYEKCKKCWRCTDYCPEGIIFKIDEKPTVEYTWCKGCGICAHECPFKAIEMVRE